MQKRTFTMYTTTTLLLALLAVLLFAQNIVHAQSESEAVGVRGEATLEAETRTEAGVDANAEADAQAEAVFCTADAYQCPNGEWVGRTGPNCEFVCSGEVHEREPADVDENNADDDAGRDAEPGVRVVPSQTKVLTPAGTDTDADGSIVATQLGGIEIEARDLDSDDDGLDDGTESAVSQSGEATVHVNGAIVRGWDAETKEAVKARVAQASNQSNANDFGLRVAMHAVEHEEITDIEVEEAETSVIFATKLYVLGFIPVNTTAKATAQSNGEVKTIYPWWSVLAKKSDGEKESVFASIATSLSTDMAMEVQGE